uniref:Uncharacterized protein n=1 Tax=Arundo donax TaxID=35708 RepID=A0A0A9AAC5_ARUDO
MLYTRPNNIHCSLMSYALYPYSLLKFLCAIYIPNFPNTYSS